MTEENSTISHLSVAMTTNGSDETQAPRESSMTSSFSHGDGLYMYWKCALLLVGAVGVAGNALILYALVASKQQKKHALIVNQNVLDLFSSFFLLVTVTVALCNIHLTGLLGYWLCVVLLGECLVWCATNGSMTNLAIITIDRYLKVVHPIWSRKWLRPWVVHSAMAFSWFAGIFPNALTAFYTATVIDGKCYSYVYENDATNMAALLLYLLLYYVIILVIFIFCYWRILAKIRHQASVMASHSSSGPSTAQTQSHQIQTNVIKTMVQVSAFYAIAWLPYNTFNLFASTGIVPITFADTGYVLTSFLAFFYTGANPFIYATKFHPVREILRKMIPCKTSVQPAG